MKTIKLNSRYRDVDTKFTFIDENSGIFTTTGDFVRVGLQEEGRDIAYLDFEGGPMIGIGSTIEGTDKKIKRIKACYYAELE